MFRHALFVIISTALIGCVGNGPKPDDEDAFVADLDSAQENESNGAEQIPAPELTKEPEQVPLLDKTQRTVFEITNGAAQKIDSFFLARTMLRMMLKGFHGRAS